jgi:uncharacterized protein (TIGR03089 family)
MDVGKPFLTYYDDSTGERTELSSSTFANWVAKTVNYLRDEHGVGPGTTVGLDVPDHWLTVVLAFGAWRAGATVVRGPGDVTFGARDLAELREDVLIHADTYAGGADLPDGPADPRRRLVEGDVLDAALAAYRGGGSVVFGTIHDRDRVAEVERASR